MSKRLSCLQTSLRRHNLNRCLLWPLDSEGDQKILVLGCHFGRTARPFVYSIKENRFEEDEHWPSVDLDMYRSNDVAYCNQGSIIIRPFV